MNLKLLGRLFSLLLSVVIVAGFSSCDNSDDPAPPADDSKFDVTIEGNITANTTLDATKRYLLKGKVYVQSGATLTIPAGTKLFGDKGTQGTLVINRGGKIDARGTASNPIIMTSSADKGFRNRGDWGGVVICGRAYTNGNANSAIEGITASGNDNGTYGHGTNTPVEDDNSGTLEFVRIEFAGIPLSQDNELNSLTMGSVGSGTKIEHIQISYANDDAYEWFGGTVNHKYLIAQYTLDDDFDTDRGYTGKVQFGLVVRDPLQADFSGSRAFETSSNNTADVNALPDVPGGFAKRHSAPEFSNITVLGPRLFRAVNQINGFYQAALEINTSSSTKVYNSVITGFTTGVRWNASGANALVDDNVIVGHGTLTAVSGGSTVPANFATDNNTTALLTDVFGAFTAKSPSDAASNNVYTLSGLGFNPFQVTGSPGLTGFVSPGSGFETVTYRGAFGTAADAGWSYSAGWINYDPINADY